MFFGGGPVTAGVSRYRGECGEFFWPFSLKQADDVPVTQVPTVACQTTVQDPFYINRTVIAFVNLRGTPGEETMTGNAGFFSRNFTGFSVSTPRCFLWVRNYLNSAQLVNACGA